MADNSFTLDPEVFQELRKALLNLHDHSVAVHRNLSNFNLPTGSLGKQLQQSLGNNHDESNQKHGTILDAIGTNIDELMQKMIDNYGAANEASVAGLRNVIQPGSSR